MSALRAMTKAQLIAEVERLTKVRKKKPTIVRPKQPSPKGAITAGCDLLKDDLIVVDEENRIGWPHPEVKTVPGKFRIHGYAVRSFRQGQKIRLHHWFDYDPS